MTAVELSRASAPRKVTVSLKDDGKTWLLDLYLTETGFVVAPTEAERLLRRRACDDMGSYLRAPYYRKCFSSEGTVIGFWIFGELYSKPLELSH